MKNSMSLPWAANCSRRKALAGRAACQYSKAPQLPFLRICSAAQQASMGRVGAIHNQLPLAGAQHTLLGM